ncbi:adenylate kinase family protein [Halocatena pleomorpha]|uniref:Putative adenylate kinase n=1 Tax=Halocatena pleomorpha TaxID=1785090 RepID=A0A3P3RJ32_9EURY|nr:AAA family ATPase [Halocatena pleomorpha]RRJ33536.1 adenylate kinase [Halocatena pleomorpha]
MKLAITGTPGTGKTTAAQLLEPDVVHLNEVIREQGLYTETDDTRDSRVVDFDRTETWLAEREPTIVESHLAHHFEAERVVVLRCHPEKLHQRLRERGESEASAEENAEAEALDVILVEALDRHADVYEIDTTDQDPSAVATEINRVLADEREPSAGNVDFTEYL